MRKGLSERNQCRRRSRKGRKTRKSAFCDDEEKKEDPFLQRMNEAGKKHLTFPSQKCPRRRDILFPTLSTEEEVQKKVYARVSYYGIFLGWKGPSI